MGKKNKYAYRPSKIGSFESQFNQAVIQNEYAYYHYCKKIMTMACSCFHWEGLPPTVNQSFLERVLFTHGAILFFHDEILGYLALPSMPMGELDVYNLPKRRVAYSTNTKNFYRDDKNSVFIFDNVMMTSDLSDMHYFASELYRNKRTRDINLNSLKTPIILEADEDERLTMENLFAKYDGNEPVIKYKKGTSIGQLNALSFNVPYYVDKLDKHEQQIWSNTVEFFGIPGVNNLKRERQTSEEVFSNMGATSVLAGTRLEQRQIACKEINRIFGLNVSVRWADNLERFYDMDYLEGGEEYGAVHDTGKDDM